MKKVLTVAALLLAATTGTAFAGDKLFNIKIDGKSAKANAKGESTIVITPAAGYHVNQEFPLKLKLTAPGGVKLEKDVIAKGDKAAKLEEQKLGFTVAYTADSPGKKTITGELKFAVCKGEQECLPQKETVSIDVDVK